ncbi:MAG: undecaprenyl-diphosphate phosphatase [Thiohalomonadales bacterium]
METVQIVALALLQGFTEFLPISSSAHLILVPKIIESWGDQGLAFDVAVHVGTLAAVLVYFRKQVSAMAVDWTLSLTGKKNSENSRLAWAVLLGTIPVGLAGLIFKDYIELNLRSTSVIATTTIVFGLLLWWADARGSRARDESTINIKDVLVIGVAQALALIPGTSRSGATITAGLMMGLRRDAAARFSFLLSIPVIILSGGLVTIDLIKDATPVDWVALSMGAGISGLTAFACIHVFLKLVDKIGMLPFVIYRLLLGGILFYYYV